ncbi:MAG TPA: protein translocase subunit SecF [Myxococcota bacterium]|jgi:preprotein translocase subunit SecF|nr:protein translocase subunit SecF [Myxococcota bacterium]
MFQIIKPGTNIDFVGKRVFFGWLSTVLNIAVVLWVLLTTLIPSMHRFGLNYGIDFAGGSTIRVRVDTTVERPAVPDSKGIEDAVKSLGLPSPEVQRVGTTGNQFLILLKRVVSDITTAHLDKIRASLAAMPSVGADGVKKVDFTGEGGDRVAVAFNKDVDQAVIGTAMKAAGIDEFEVIKRGREGESREFLVKLTSLGNRVRAAIAAKYGAATLESSESVGPRAGEKLRSDGAKSVIFALLGILLYVGFRFDFRFAPGAVIATLHDVLMTTGFYLITRLEFNLTSIAVLLTIVGYSVNDTVIVYDRIRENQARLRDKRLDLVINISTNETLSRTILTSGVTSLSLIAVPFIASGSIRDFALALLFGIVTGTYSSIYIASPIVLWLDEKLSKRKGAAALAGAAAGAVAGRKAKAAVAEDDDEDEADEPDESAADDADEGDDGGDADDDEK